MLSIQVFFPNNVASRFIANRNVVENKLMSTSCALNIKLWTRNTKDRQPFLLVFHLFLESFVMPLFYLVQ